MIHGGLSERHALRVIGMSASAYRYQPAPDRNLAFRAQIVPLPEFAQPPLREFRQQANSPT